MRTQGRYVVGALVLFCGIAGWGLAAENGGNLLTNGSFSNDIGQWSTWYAPGFADGHAVWEPRTAEDGCLHAVIERTDRVSAVQIYQGPFAVEAGAWYSVRFEVRSADSAPITVALMGNDPPYSGLGLRTRIASSPDWQRYEFLVVASHSVDNARLDFFPTASFFLDSVVVSPLGAAPPELSVSSVSLGKGIAGSPGSLTDGDMATAVNAGYFPRLPLYVTCDLGEPVSVGAVAVTTWDHGRHYEVRDIEIQVSDSGSSWHAWTSTTRSRGEARGRRRLSRFQGSGRAVRTRYVRIKIASCRGVAPVSEIKVFGASAGELPAQVGLPIVSEEDGLCFIGWDYAGCGYDLTPGEPCMLRFDNRGDTPIDTEVDWLLETYAGDSVTAGSSALRLSPASEAAMDVALPDDLEDGHYRLRLSVGTTWREAFHFDYRAGQAVDGGSLRLGAYLDCQDPEGWVRLMLGRLGESAIVARRRPGDAAIVAAPSWDETRPEVGELRRYIESGGLALVFGLPPRGLLPAMPGEVVAEGGWSAVDKRLGDAVFWPEFRRADCPRMSCLSLRGGAHAEVLARWHDGSAAVLLGKLGEGRVVWIGTAAGRCWQRGSQTGAVDELAIRLLAYLLDRKLPVQGTALSSEVVEEGWREGSSRGNLGRFGWLSGEGGLVETITPDRHITCVVSRSGWQMDVPGVDETRAPRRADGTWFWKQLCWEDEAGHRVLSADLSLGSPFTLWQADSSRISLAGHFTGALVQRPQGIGSLRPGEHVSGQDLAAGWLVLVNGDSTVRDAPGLLMLTRRPRTVSLGEGGVTVDYGERPCGSYLTGRLFGIRRFAEGETASWLERPPSAVARQASQSVRWALMFPTSCRETYRIGTGSVTIRNQFTHRRLSSEWGTEGRVGAPVPPVLSLFRRHAAVSPAMPEGLVDTGIATKDGPFEVVPFDTLLYRLPMPVTGHYGVIPPKEGMPLQDLIDRHGTESLRVGRKAPGGLVSGEAFVEDLREYMSSPRYDDPFDAPCLDTYKFWYCFPAMAALPFYTEEAREEIGAHYRRVVRTTLARYPHRTTIRHRREPFTGLDYTVSFIWPVVWRDGVRFFVDQNESAAVIAFCLWTYAQYTGDWDLVDASWNQMRWIWRYLWRVHDWGFMCSSNQEFFSTVGIDMLNSEFPGNLAMARMARQVGDRETEARATYLAAKATVSTVVRLFMPDYLRGVTADGDPWRQDRFYWSLRETRLSGSDSVVMRGDAEAILSLAIGLLDTSKGTSPEICALYKAFAPDEIQSYEEALREAETAHDHPAGWAHLMNRAFLGWPRETLLVRARAAFDHRSGWGWQSTKAPQNLAAVCAAGSDMHLVEWAPAEYLGGWLDRSKGEVELRFRYHRAETPRARVFCGYAIEGMTLNGKAWNDWQAQEDGTLIIGLPGNSGSESMVYVLRIRIGRRTGVRSIYTGGLDASRGDP